MKADILQKFLFGVEWAKKQVLNDMRMSKWWQNVLLNPSKVIQIECEICIITFFLEIISTVKGYWDTLIAYNFVLDQPCVTFSLHFILFLFLSPTFSLAYSLPSLVFSHSSCTKLFTLHSLSLLHRSNPCTLLFFLSCDRGQTSVVSVKLALEIYWYKTTQKPQTMEMGEKKYNIYKKRKHLQLYSLSLYLLVIWAGKRLCSNKPIGSSKLGRPQPLKSDPFSFFSEGWVILSSPFLILSFSSVCDSSLRLTQRTSYDREY